MRKPSHSILGIVVLLSLSLCRASYAATAISYGQTLTGSISTTGEQDEYTFTGTAGEVVTARLSKFEALSAVFTVPIGT